MLWDDASPSMQKLCCVRKEGGFRALLVLRSGLLACMRREQFEIPQPTESYAQVVKLLPAEWIGGASRLVPLVQVPGVTSSLPIRHP